MSFLNPVNEPVTRFSSTDADAPQINYAARTAGDVKAVLKACLVTGYGTKSSAGWSVVNEVDNVCEFVSPSAAMSEYRLSIDDSTADQTVWAYYYADIKNTIPNSGVKKAVKGVDANHSSNGWDLIVTQRGLMFIQHAYNTAIQHVGSSITYWGQLKSSLDVNVGQNIAWWCIGFNSPGHSDGIPSGYYEQRTDDAQYYNLNGYNDLNMCHVGLPILKKYGAISNISSIEMTSPMMYSTAFNIVAQSVGYLLTVKNNSNRKPAPEVLNINNRQHLAVWPIRGETVASRVLESSHGVYMIDLTTWGF